MAIPGTDRKFGLVYFDDEQEPGAGWAATAGSAARRISGSNELSTDTMWWTNIEYGHFYRRSEAFRNPNLRHNKYLVVAPKDVLREWGHNPDGIDSPFICQFGAVLFERVMHIAWSIVSEVHPKIRFEEAFTGKTLREDLRALFPELEYPRGAAASLFKSGMAWEEFTVTNVRSPRGSKPVVLRRPRVTHANEMLQTPMPRGPFVARSRRDLKIEPAQMLSYALDEKTPCIADLTVRSMQPEVAPIYSFGAATDKDKRVSRSWVSQPELLVLNRVADLEVRSLYVGREYGKMMEELPEAVSAFLANKYSDMSWSAGIVAECLWRAVPLGEDKGKAAPLREGEDRAQTSWQGLWVRGAEKATMFLDAMRLTELGYAVTSYGLGWIRCNVPEEDVANLIKDGLGLGLVPTLSEVPDGTFRPDKPINWQGDEKARNYAFLTCVRNTDMLWHLDMVPLLPHHRRPEFMRRLMERYSQSQRAARA